MIWKAFGRKIDDYNRSIKENVGRILSGSSWKLYGMGKAGGRVAQVIALSRCSWKQNDTEKVLCSFFSNSITVGTCHKTEFYVDVQLHVSLKILDY